MTILFQGTVFVHAIANLQSTFAKAASLEISSSDGLELAETIGEYVRKKGNMKSYRPPTKVSVPLGNLQYGQSRDILLRYTTSIFSDRFSPTVRADLSCQPLNQSSGALTKSCRVFGATHPSIELISYHRSRSMICGFLSTIAPLSGIEEHIPISGPESLHGKQQELEALIAEVPARQMKDRLNQSLMEDLTGEIRLALVDQNFNRWGKHFLLSIHDAHVKQICNSSKDPGPLQYSTNSPLFNK